MAFNSQTKEDGRKKIETGDFTVFQARYEMQTFEIGSQPVSGGAKPNSVSSVSAITDTAKTSKRTGFGLVIISIPSITLFQLLRAILTL